VLPAVAVGDTHRVSAEDPQLIAVRLLQSELLAHNVRGARVAPVPGGVEVFLRGLYVLEAPLPAAGEDPRGWASATTQLVLARVAPWKQG